MWRARKHFRFSVLAIALFPLRLAAEDWPQFRGPNGSGVSTSAKPLPIKFSSTDKVRWSAVVGDGVSSPIVAGGRLFVTAMTGPQQFAVRAYDAATGKLLWRRDLETGSLPKITPPNNPAACTPASDGRRVYVHFSTLGLLAFDAADGKTAWTLPLPKPAYLMDWGAANSPIVFGDLVIFNMDDDLNCYLVAVEKHNGKVRWRTERPDMLAGYALPVICEANGRTDIVVGGCGKLKGYDPSTGKERWTCNTLPRILMTSPVVHGGVIYVAVQSYGDTNRTLKFALMEWLDTNQDGKLARAEVPPEFRVKFDRSDRNQDGLLIGDEVDTAFQSSENMAGGGNLVQAIKGGGKGDVTKTHVLWNQTKPYPSNMSSPLVVGNQLFLVKRGGLSSSFDAATGKAFWVQARIRNLGEYFSSPVAGDGKVYVTGENGFVVVLAAEPKLRILAKNDIGGRCIASPAIADGRLYFRTGDKVYCFAEAEK